MQTKFATLEQSHGEWRTRAFKSYSTFGCKKNGCFAGAHTRRYAHAGTHTHAGTQTQAHTQKNAGTHTQVHTRSYANVHAGTQTQARRHATNSSTLNAVTPAITPTIALSR